MSSDAAAPAAEVSDGVPPADTKLVEYELHINHPPVTQEVTKSCDELKAELYKEPLVTSNRVEADRFFTQQNLHRYLRARQFDQVKSKKLMLETFTWRLSYVPEAIRAATVEPECATGKICVLSHHDRHHRPIIVMDSSRENSKNHDSQLRHLVWQLERAKRKMNAHVHKHPHNNADAAAPVVPPRVEKYCLFINMERNSIWNSPPLKTSLETLKTLTERYPEHLGHAIVYKPGMLFAGLWAACKPIMDVKTVKKVIFIRGDVSPGSKNDTMLQEIIGPNWKEWCDVPKDDYSHAQFWPEVLRDEEEWDAAHPDEAAAIKAAAEQAAKAAPASK